MNLEFSLFKRKKNKVENGASVSFLKYYSMCRVIHIKILHTESHVLCWFTKRNCNVDQLCRKAVVEIPAKSQGISSSEVVYASKNKVKTRKNSRHIKWLVSINEMQHWAIMGWDYAGFCLIFPSDVNCRNLTCMSLCEPNV